MDKYSSDSESPTSTQVSIPCVVVDRLEMHTDDVEAFLADVDNYDLPSLDCCPCCGEETTR